MSTTLQTTTKLILGPIDHGRRVTPASLERAEYVSGFKYEIIDGRLYVSPQPNVPEMILERWLRIALEQYSEEHPEIINLVAVKSRVYLPEGKGRTVPEPDIAVYADFPLDAPITEIRWEDTQPILVCEILVDGSIEKDLGRNPPLYLAVPSIKEYWVLNGSVNPAQPTLMQHRRRGKRWIVTHHPFQATFTTPLLPGFELILDPRPNPRKKS
jgi:Uma2 family endonuclease